MSPPEQAFRQVDERELIATSYLRFVEASFVDPDGSSFQRQIVRHPGAVCIVPVEADGTVVMIRQFRAPLGRAILEIPAGKLDVPGEPPDECAAARARRGGRPGRRPLQRARFVLQLAGVQRRTHDVLPR